MVDLAMPNLIEARVAAARRVDNPYVIARMARKAGAFQGL